MAQDFVTSNHNDYKYPFPRPIVARPCEPPGPATVPEPPRPVVPPYCHCDSHAYEPQIEQYKQLLDKEDELCREYFKLRGQIAHVVNEVLDHPCDNDDIKMDSIYKITYVKKGFKQVPYRSIMSVVEHAKPPLETHRIGRLEAYRDPTTFTHVHQPVTRAQVEPPTPAHTGVEPASVTKAWRSYPGRTEYMDNYSKVAVANWRSMQRYKEPLPSTRRRADDKCI